MLFRSFVQELNTVQPEVSSLKVSWQQAHRWRYSRVDLSQTASVATQVDAGLAIAGDWLIDGTVQGAWQSAQAVAKLLR